LDTKAGSRADPPGLDPLEPEVALEVVAERGPVCEVDEELEDALARRADGDLCCDGANGVAILFPWTSGVTGRIGPIDDEADRDMTAGELHCMSCARAPLVGEWATLHAGSGRRSHPGWLCELCENDPKRSARAGTPLRRERLLPAGALHLRHVA